MARQLDVPEERQAQPRADANAPIVAWTAVPHLSCHFGTSAAGVSQSRATRKLLLPLNRTRQVDDGQSGSEMAPGPRLVNVHWCRCSRSTPPRGQGLDLQLESGMSDGMGCPRTGWGRHQTNRRQPGRPPAQRSLARLKRWEHSVRASTHTACWRLV